jgi:hypothetical protein
MNNLPPLAEEIDDDLPVTQPQVARRGAKPPAPPPAPGRSAAGRAAAPQAKASTQRVVPTKKASVQRTVPGQRTAPVQPQVPTGWDDDAAGAPTRTFGPVGLVAAALLLMVVVYLGATLLMKQ